jgi:Flp pilus assembly protein TadD
MSPSGSYLWAVFAWIAPFAAFLIPLASAQSDHSHSADPVAIQGIVHDSAGAPVGEATVRLERTDAPAAVETRTSNLGTFVFSTVATGNYLISAERSGLRSSATTFTVSSHQDLQTFILVLSAPQSTPVQPGTHSPDPSQVMEFADKPSFSVAGVTDWTAVGGHGSDSTLRTSEALTRETLALKSEGIRRGTNESTGDREQAAEAHRLAGVLAEKSGDPLAAVHEFEQAVRLSPTEQNYFEWGAELLLHRAVWQAQQVFENGAKAYPKSSRMIIALGTALFAGARYDEAARRLCEASDLNPADPEPYNFLGKIEMAAPNPLECVEPKLARFVEQQPNNSQANYLYAMALLRRQSKSADDQVRQHAEALLATAVTIDSKCSDAFLQLGILSASQHNFKEAIVFYDKAIGANPELADAHYRLGVAYDRIGEQEKARQEFLLHDEIKRREAEDIERQRREVKQFLVVVPGQVPDAPIH